MTVVLTDLLVAYGKTGVSDSEFIYLDALGTTFEQFEILDDLSNVSFGKPSPFK